MPLTGLFDSKLGWTGGGFKLFRESPLTPLSALTSLQAIKSASHEAQGETHERKTVKNNGKQWQNDNNKDDYNNNSKCVVLVAGACNC